MLEYIANGVTIRDMQIFDSVQPARTYTKAELPVVRDEKEIAIRMRVLGSPSYNVPARGSNGYTVEHIDPDGKLAKRMYYTIMFNWIVGIKPVRMNIDIYEDRIRIATAPEEADRIQLPFIHAVVEAASLLLKD